MLLPDETYEDYHHRTSSKENTETDNSKSASSSSSRILEFPPTNEGHRHAAKSNGSSSYESTGYSTSNSGSYKKTNEFFENIPEIEDEAFTEEFVSRPQQRVPLNNRCAKGTRHSRYSFYGESEDLSTNPHFLRNCEAFIQQYHIRPDFFCQYYKAIR